ncbi:MAG: hypothetical protein H6R04_1752 [Burkholderiaceae bacterium]|nr:hypothetical protein [Burkholderiaceae bacterium]
MRITQERKIAAGQEFEIDAFRPEDAPGIANLLLSVYGPSYPFDLYYDPEKIVEVCRKRELFMVVARTPAGDIIASGGLYQSAPPNRKLFEVGLYMVLPDYRETDAAFRITKYLSNEMLATSGLDGFFGEAVTNHMASQKVSWLAGTKETAIEMLLTPASMYQKEQSASGRVSCVMSFRIEHDQPQTLHLPLVYADILRPFISKCGLERTLRPADAESTLPAASQIDGTWIADAGVLRLHVANIGADFTQRLAQAEIETVADAPSVAVRQCFVRLTDSAIELAVAQLRAQGYFLGGYLPRWFGDDALMMQQLSDEPDFDAIQIYYDDTIALLETIRADRQQVLQQKK